MTQFLAIFPIHAPAPETRHHRAALNQLPHLVPDDVTITGTWTGHTWTDPDGRQWYVMTAPAEGTGNADALATARQAAHHIDPRLAAWIDGTAPTPVEPALTPKSNATRPRLEQLQHLLAAGESIEDAITACGWSRARSAGAAARRAGNLTLARTLESVSAAA